MSKIPRWWIITVGNNYGSYAVFDTKENAEKMRAAKANWEGAVAQLRLADQRKPADKEMVAQGRRRPQGAEAMTPETNEPMIATPQDLRDYAAGYGNLRERAQFLAAADAWEVSIEALEKALYAAIEEGGCPDGYEIAMDHQTGRAALAQTKDYPRPDEDGAL